MSFPEDIKFAMRDCILKLLWAKGDIVSFFKNNSCTASDINAIGDQSTLSRAAIVGAMFDHLSAKPDHGLGQFRAMLQSLIGWSHFDPYYFDKLKKLNRGEAERAIVHLKQLQEIRDYKLQEQRKERDRKEAAAKSPKVTLTELKAKFIALLQGEVSGAKRGYGDQHRGLCMGYTTNRLPEPVFHKVIYGGSRSIKTSVLVRAFTKGEQLAKAELDRDVLLRKARGWGYEREWRLIGEQGLQDSPLFLLDVTFGLRCPASVMHSVIKALAGREKAVNFYEMYEVRNKFVLRRRKLNMYELSAQLPRTAESGIEIFGADTETDAVQAGSHEASVVVV